MQARQKRHQALEAPLSVDHPSPRCGGGRDKVINLHGHICGGLEEGFLKSEHGVAIPQGGEHYDLGPEVWATSIQDNPWCFALIKSS